MDKNLFGYWEMTDMRWKLDDGSWESEKVYGGHSVFTRSGHITTFTRAEIPFGYSGKFRIEGNNLVITPEVSSIPEIEGTTIIRTVKEVKPESLVLTMTDPATEREYEILFKLITNSFH